MTVPATYVPLVAQADAVIHAAQLSAGGRLTRRRAAAVFAADRLMTRALADACLANRSRLIYTAGCFDWVDYGEQWIDERTARHPSPMGVGHAEQASYLDARHRSDGLDVVRLSPAFVYGPGGLFRSASSIRPEPDGCVASARAATGGVVSMWTILRQRMSSR